MLQLPFDIPRSLSSYAEQFEKEPEKAISRLQAQLDKRGPNAVGYFLLAWFHLLKGDREKAVARAVQAKTHAPGSPFLENLPYYLSHPDLLEAWTPEYAAGRGVSRRDSRGPVMDLDRLIEQLSSIDTSPPESMPPIDGPAAETTDNTEDVDDIVSDTLADIHARQGKISLAISLYERLMKRDDHRKEYYREQIEKLRSRQEGEREEEADGDSEE